VFQLRNLSFAAWTKATASVRVSLSVILIAIVSLVMKDAIEAVKMGHKRASA
jgi:hypothetical protein